MIVILTYLIALGQLVHVIAGSVPVMCLALTGAASWSDYIVGFLAPAVLGNTVGGVVLVALLNHAQSDLKRKLDRR